MAAFLSPVRECPSRAATLASAGRLRRWVMLVSNRLLFKKQLCVTLASNRLVRHGITTEDNRRNGRQPNARSQYTRGSKRRRAFPPSVALKSRLQIPPKSAMCRLTVPGPPSSKRNQSRQAVEMPKSTNQLWQLGSFHVPFCQCLRYHSTREHGCKKDLVTSNMFLRSSLMYAQTIVIPGPRLVLAPRTPITAAPGESC